MLIQGHDSELELKEYGFGLWLDIIIGGTQYN